jgi:hypothetical protein
MYFEKVLKNNPNLPYWVDWSGISEEKIELEWFPLTSNKKGLRVKETNQFIISIDPVKLGNSVQAKDNHCYWSLNTKSNTIFNTYPRLAEQYTIVEKDTESNEEKIDKIDVWWVKDKNSYFIVDRYGRGFKRFGSVNSKVLFLQEGRYWVEEPTNEKINKYYYDDQIFYSKVNIVGEWNDSLIEGNGDDKEAVREVVREVDKYNFDEDVYSRNGKVSYLGNGQWEFSFNDGFKIILNVDHNAISLRREGEKDEFIKIKENFTEFEVNGIEIKKYA